jgi:hypothetical protein
VRRKLGRNALARFAKSDVAGVQDAALAAAEHLPPANEHPYGRKSKAKAT